MKLKRKKIIIFIIFSQKYSNYIVQKIANRRTEKSDGNFWHGEIIGNLWQGYGDVHILRNAIFQLFRPPHPL
jgi:hypothetical protein